MNVIKKRKSDKSGYTIGRGKLASKSGQAGHNLDRFFFGESLKISTLMNILKVSTRRE